MIAVLNMISLNIVHQKLFYTRSYYRKENAADMYMQDVLQPIHCIYRKCTIKYKLGGHMCISVEHVLWVNFKLKVVQAAIIIYYS